MTIAQEELLNQRAREWAAQGQPPEAMADRLREFAIDWNISFLEYELERIAETALSASGAGGAPAAAPTPPQSGQVGRAKTDRRQTQRRQGERRKTDERTRKRGGLLSRVVGGDGPRPGERRSSDRRQTDRRQRVRRKADR